MNDIIYHHPRPLIVFLHGGAGIKGRPDDKNITPLDGWGIDATFISLDYPIKPEKWSNTVWVTARTITLYAERYNASEIIVIGTSHGGWLAARLVAHYIKHPTSKVRLPDKVVMLYAPTVLTRREDFMTLPENVWEMYNEFFTGSRLDTIESQRARLQASLLGRDYGDVKILAIHGDEDNVVSSRQWQYTWSFATEVMSVPRAGHGFNPLHIPEVKQTITRFILE